MTFFSIAPQPADWRRKYRRRRYVPQRVRTVAPAADAKTIKVGFLYAATRNDYGFNQSFAVAAKRIAQLPGVTVVEQERVPETAQAERAMESMIQVDGCKAIVATSFGYWPFVLKAAAKYPMSFSFTGSAWKEGDPKNAIGYRGYMEEPHYLCGLPPAE